jgi:uncharacterized protein YbaA (DUF1428 family)
MRYVDGFVFVVKKKNIQKYRKIADKAGKLWKKHGALEYVECVGDDMKPEMITLTFPKLTKAKPDEVVCFSFIIYKTKADRNKINKKVMKDMEREFPEHSAKDMPFDVRKMSFAGFRSIVDLS